jgi:hypothetical protein
MAAPARPVTDATEVPKVMNLLRTTIFSEYAALSMPQPEEIVLYRVLPTLVSVLDYSKCLDTPILGGVANPAMCNAPKGGRAAARLACFARPTRPLLTRRRSPGQNQFKLVAGKSPKGGCDDPQQTFD